MKRKHIAGFTGMVMLLLLASAPAFAQPALPPGGASAPLDSGAGVLLLLIAFYGYRALRNDTVLE